MAAAFLSPHRLCQLLGERFSDLRDWIPKWRKDKILQGAEAVLGTGSRHGPILAPVALPVLWLVSSPGWKFPDRDLPVTGCILNHTCDLPAVSVVQWFKVGWV